MRKVEQIRDQHSRLVTIKEIKEDYLVCEATKADQSKIPLITVPGNTHDVVEKLEDLQQNIEFNHKEKLEYMVSLVEKNISIELISDALETTPTG